VPIERPTPFAFPLMVERLRERLSTEQLEVRIARMLAQAERGS
jgi:ATP-dependent Lhr-like helicase